MWASSCAVCACDGRRPGWGFCGACVTICRGCRARPASSIARGPFYEVRYIVRVSLIICPWPRFGIVSTRVYLLCFLAPVTPRTRHAWHLERDAPRSGTIRDPTRRTIIASRLWRLLAAGAAGLCPEKQRRHETPKPEMPPRRPPAPVVSQRLAGRTAPQHSQLSERTMRIWLRRKQNTLSALAIDHHGPCMKTPSSIMSTRWPLPCRPFV